jgi:hypothetical protein
VIFGKDNGCNRRSHLGAWHAPGRRLEPNARLCVAVAQVVLRSKVKAVALRFEVKRQKTSTSSVSVREPPSPAQAGLFFGALLTPRGDVFAFKGATCPSTGSATATTIKFPSLIELGASLIHARVRASLAGLDEGAFTEGQ